MHQDPETPQRLRQNCVWVSPEEVQASSGLPQGQGLWVKEEKMTDIVLLTFLSLSHISQTSLYFL